VRWLGEKPFHSVLLLTEKPAEWAVWQIAPIPLGLAAVSGLVWARVTGELAWGWAIALGLLAFALLDWGLLASLPRRGISFGAVQPPFLALCVLRWAVALIAVPLGVWWPLPTVIALAFLQILIWTLMVYGTLIEPFRLRVTCVEVPTRKFSNPGVPVRIVQLSDLHVERLTRRDRALPELVAGLAPDLIVLTGDFLSTSYNEDPRALEDLRTLLAQVHAPAGIYAIWGTIRDLVADGAMLRALLANAPPGAFTLLLYHTPDLMPQASALGVDLYLAGHTHGGQWRLPGFGAILTSSHHWKRYESGHYREGNTRLYVSRGLGMEGFGTPRARILCPPEVVEVVITGMDRGV
jgi:predicted MPP superfamily phosphohydrolase